ncbi:TfoX/Sxy family protein [Streptomyces albicerus]|uniref:TfoX/Sxy family protein n=1 Tax=Streptomyces albicerus TaxID=2569859 RepID=UPI00124B7605|nr:TfoX/Sxy family protein [Streptomyces albicerus]
MHGLYVSEPLLFHGLDVSRPLMVHGISCCTAQPPCHHQHGGAFRGANSSHQPPRYGPRRLGPQEVAERIREVLSPVGDVGERKMFGGLAFLLAGHMFCGVVHDELMIRLGPEGTAETLARPGVRPMDSTGRTMKSMVFVAPEALAGAVLDEWVSRAVAYARTLPTK